MANVAKRVVWDEESLHGRAKNLGYWVCKVLCHRHSYWFLVKIRPMAGPKTEAIFAGRKGRDFISLGALGNADAVMAAIGVLEDQQAAAQADETEEEEEHVTPPSQFDAYKRRVRKERDDA